MKRLLFPIVSLVVFFACIFTIQNIANKNKQIVINQRYQHFWSWFSANSDDYFYNFEKDKNLTYKLNKELKELDAHFTFELGPINEGKRDFIISTSGCGATFPAAVSLIKAAPKLKNWRIYPFITKIPKGQIIKDGNLKISYDDVYFTYRYNDKTVDIDLYIKGYKPESEEYDSIGYVFLDRTLGEINVDMKVNNLRFFPLPDKTTKDLIKSQNLPYIVSKVEGYY